MLKITAGTNLCAFSLTHQLYLFTFIKITYYYGRDKCRLRSLAVSSAAPLTMFNFGISQEEGHCQDGDISTAIGLI